MAKNVLFGILIVTLQFMNGNNSRITIRTENLAALDIVREVYTASSPDGVMIVDFDVSGEVLGIIEGYIPWQNGEIYLFDTSTFESTTLFEDADLKGTDLHFTHDWLLVGNEEGEVRRYDLTTERLIDVAVVSPRTDNDPRFGNVGGDVEVIATSPDETYFAAVSTSEFFGDNVFYLSQFGKEPTLVVPRGDSGRGYSVVFYPSSDLVVFATGMRNEQDTFVTTIQIADVRSGEIVSSCDSFITAFYYTDSLQVISKGESVYYLADDGIRIWDGRNCADFPDAWRLLSPARENEGVMTMTLHPTEPILAVSYVSTEQSISILRFWNIEKEEMIHEITDIGEGVYNAITSLAFSPDGTLLATGGLDGVVRLWGIPADDDE